MSQNSQYDNLLGGNQELPSAIRLMNFTAARCKEIQALKQSLSTTKGGGKLIFQKLPIHMRRRVMSHNARRLPRRLREAHMNQLKKSGLGVKQKRPSRKYRRRPRNLLTEYARRQRKHKWLETHIWHAKRFHMVERWGYKLPQSPCDKAFRACYRATAQHCLVEDVSYVGCLEIIANEEVIVSKFSQMYDKNANLSIGARAFINGNREGRLTIVADSRAIGPVTFNWMPKIEINRSRSLWVWIHPSIFDAVFDLFVRVFNLNLENDEKSYENKDDNVRLYDLRFHLNRFRLTGPLSHAVLQKSLRPAVGTKNECDWLTDYLNDENKESYLRQADYWKSLENIASPGELSPHMILGLVAVDPRYSMPKKRTKALNDNTKKRPDSHLLEKMPDFAGSSPIWEMNVRKRVADNKISNFDLYKAREKLLVPGTDLNTPGMPVPYLLIQRPGNKDRNLGYCSGWDLIMPSGWAQPTWLTLIMWGARAGGLREAESAQFEMGKPSILEPDTDAGREEDRRSSELYNCRYFSLPPNKRVNYNKLSIATPFECKWNVLLNDWLCSPDQMVQFSVLRDRKILATLQEHLTSKNKSSTNLDIDLNGRYIVPVKLTQTHKGTPKRYSIICLPNKDDLILSRDQFSINEPQVTDANQAERQRLRKEHKEILQKLQRYRKRCKLTGRKYNPKRNYVEEYKREMTKLWLPDVKCNVRQSCSREIVGWITKGDFSFTAGNGVGVGYIVLPSFSKLFSSQNRNKVLVRNTSSRQYRIATLQVVT